ncbi:MAG: porin, partial [Proteobacteria bacterium]|nr:porin [Pseudomonadota bacterium]
PENGLATNVYGFSTPNDERYPDLVARLNYLPEWGSLSLSGMGRQIRYAPAKTSGQQEAWGGGVSLTGRINTFGLDNVRFMLGYGDALGRYASTNTFEDATLDATGDLQLVNTYSAMLAYQHWWDNAWRSNLAYGFAQADQPALTTGDLTRRAQSVLLNLLWSPVLQTTFGLEYIYATRTTVEGESGDLHRLIFSTRYNF